ncbi:putative toxin [Nocardia farcinica]|uniref:putative toxin n=1 Tax=Nocardia farcinica TaxID=37329 RepID=UPI002454BDBA|nr:putative toxin [Nocardia farcinica]
MAQLDVDPELFYDLSGQYSTASRAASAALSKMDSELRSAVKMCGDDDCGVSWGRGYFVSGIEAVVTAGRATEVLAKMAALVRQSGVNHDRSESVEEYNNGTLLPPSDPGAKTYTARPLKSPAGGTRPQPELWTAVMSPDVDWINGDADMMSRVSTSWLNAASVYGSLDTELRAKMKNLAGSRTDELPDIEQAHTTILEGIETLSDAMRNIAGAVDGYAQVLKAAQENAEWHLALGQVVTAINIINAATVGRPIAREILEVQELEIEQCRRNIQQGLDGLVAAEQTATGTFTAASGTVRYVVNAKFQPVLDKQLKTPPPPLSGGTARRNKLEGAKGEARAGIDPVKPKESFVGSTGARRVPDDIDHGQKRLTEVKNVQQQSLTEQIKDDLIYCQTNGYEFVLITDTNTKLTAPLQGLVDQGRIKHVTMDLQS